MQNSVSLERARLEESVYNKSMTWLIRSAVTGKSKVLWSNRHPNTAFPRVQDAKRDVQSSAVSRPPLTPANARGQL